MWFHSFEGRNNLFISIPREDFNKRERERGRERKRKKNKKVSAGKSFQDERVISRVGKIPGIISSESIYRSKYLGIYRGIYFQNFLSNPSENNLLNVSSMFTLPMSFLLLHLSPLSLSFFLSLFLSLSFPLSLFFCFIFLSLTFCLLFACHKLFQMRRSQESSPPSLSFFFVIEKREGESERERVYPSLMQRI